jgi:hypothetical protein
MLQKTRFCIPEIFFGMLLAVALFLMGAMFWSSQYSGPSTQAPSASHRADEETQDQQHKGLWDWLTHDAAGFFTVCLAVVGGGQLVLFYVQLKLIRESLVDAQKAADASAKGANAAEGAAQAAGRQAKIAEESFSKLERPYVFIFDVHRFGRNQRSGEFSVGYKVANYGKIPAIIEQPHIGFVVDNRGWPPVPVLMNEDHGLMTNPILQPGEVRSFNELLPEGMSDGGAIIELDAAGNPTGNSSPSIVQTEGFQTFFRGVVKYRGPFTHGHETSATWWYFAEIHQFVSRGGEEYNYVK